MRKQNNKNNGDSEAYTPTEVWKAVFPKFHNFISNDKPIIFV